MSPFASGQDAARLSSPNARTTVARASLPAAMRLVSSYIFPWAQDVRTSGQKSQSAKTGNLLLLLLDKKDRMFQPKDVASQDWRLLSLCLRVITSSG